MPVTATCLPREPRHFPGSRFTTDDNRAPDAMIRYRIDQMGSAVARAIEMLRRAPCVDEVAPAVVELLGRAAASEQAVYWAVDPEQLRLRAFTRWGAGVWLAIPVPINAPPFVREYEATSMRLTSGGAAGRSGRLITFPRRGSRHVAERACSGACGLRSRPIRRGTVSWSFAVVRLRRKRRTTSCGWSGSGSGSVMRWSYCDTSGCVCRLRGKHPAAGRRSSRAERVAEFLRGGTAAIILWLVLDVIRM
jgi:hypothetical protein